LARAICSDGDFINLFKQHGGAETARRLGINERNTLARRASLEKKYNIQIKAPAYNNTNTRHAEEKPQRTHLKIKNGVVLVCGDGHYWPGEATTAHKAFVKFCKTMEPQAVIVNGDAFDGAGISRHPPIGWENHPTVVEELEAVQTRLSEIELATFKIPKVWTLGNHDARFETRLATVAREYACVHGFHLKDHFPNWQACWSAWINDGLAKIPTVVKHRFKGGTHAPHNNAVAAGVNMITNHLHAAKVSPVTDYNGTRYAADTGCIADPDGPQFVDYSEDNPRNHRSGFAVLTFRDYELMLPELALVWDRDHVQFRGQLIRCSDETEGRKKAKARAS
jgi:hypothetical protein